MAWFAGLRGTGSFSTGERPKSFREMILWANPNGSAPLFALTSKAKTEPVDDPDFSWWEETNTIARVRINAAGGYAAGITSLVVDLDALQLIPGDLLLVEPLTQVVAYADEIVRVISVTSDTAFVVARGQAGTTAATIPDDAYLFRIGNAQSEGNLSVASSSSNPTKYNNYTQIFKTPYQITNTALATKFLTGDPKKNEQKRKSFQHSEKIEEALLWGKAFETVDATNGNMPIRYTMGLRQFIVSNRTVFTADPTEIGFLNAIAPVFDYDAGGAGNERIIFAGNEALIMLNMLVKNAASTQINYDGEVKAYGMNLSKWTIPQGTLYIKSHPLMNVHPTYKSSMFVVNMAGITYRPLRGRDTKLEKEIQPNDADYVKDQWLTEAGFEFHFERTFAYIGGFKDW